MNIQAMYTGKRKNWQKKYTQQLISISCQLLMAK